MCWKIWEILSYTQVILVIYFNSLNGSSRLSGTSFIEWLSSQAIQFAKKKNTLVIKQIFGVWTIPTNVGFCWFGHSSDCLVVSTPFVNSHTWLCRHFTGCAKKQTEGGRKKQDNCKCRKVKLALFSILCMFIAITRTLQKSYTTTKNADSSGLCLHCSCPGLGFLTLCSRVPLPTDCFGVLLLTDWCPSSYSSGLTSFHEHSPLCGLHTKIDKGMSSRHADTTSKMLEIRFPLKPPIHEHTQRVFRMLHVGVCWIF